MKLGKSSQKYEGKSFLIKSNIEKEEKIIKIIKDDTYIVLEEPEENTETLQVGTGYINRVSLTYISKDQVYLYLDSAEYKALIITKEEIELADKLYMAQVYIGDISEEILEDRNKFSYPLSPIKWVFQKFTKLTENEINQRVIELVTKGHNNNLTEKEILVTIFLEKEIVQNIGSRYWMYRAEKTEYFSSSREGVYTPAKLVTLGNDLHHGMPDCTGSYYTNAVAYENYRLLYSKDSTGGIDDILFIALDTQNIIIEGIAKIIPSNLKKVTLSNAIMTGTLKMDNDATIIVEGVNTINVGDFTQCIEAGGTLTIKGTGVLNLQCQDYSAIIGLGALAQSHERYVPRERGGIPDEIIFDKVRVNVKSKTPNFSLGRYGDNNNIKIRINNNAQIKGIEEIEHEVILESVGYTSSGSTKISGPATYIKKGRDEKKNEFSSNIFG